MALSEFRARKVAHLFDAYDVDGDGFIDHADYLRFSDSLAAAGAIDAAGKAKLDSETTALWNQIREHADTSRDGRVSASEWTAWQTSLDDAAGAGGGAFPLEKYISALVDVLDTDNDGKVSLREYDAGIAAYGYKNVDVAGNFAKFDTDGDGFLSREEVIAVSAAFWFSEDPDAAENYIYGPF